MLLNALYLFLVLGEKLAEWGFMDAQAFCECGMFVYFFFFITARLLKFKTRKNCNKLYNQGQGQLE